MNGGPAGDLYITFVIGDDPVYKREGDNLYMNVDRPLYRCIRRRTDYRNLERKSEDENQARNTKWDKGTPEGKGFPYINRMDSSGIFLSLMK